MINPIYGISPYLVHKGALLNLFPVPSLQEHTTEFEVIQKSSLYYFKALKGEDFLITNCDLQLGQKGFDYKSEATIDCFGLTGVPVISLFQNFDYGNQYFTKHAAQVLDANGVETTQAHVSALVEYSAPLTGADLTAANTYFDVPVKLTTAIREVGTGKNYATVALALSASASKDTIYVYSGNYDETWVITNKGITIKSVGYVSNIKATGQAIYVNSTSADPINIIGINCPITAAISINFNVCAGAFSVDKCRLKGTASIYKTTANITPISISNCLAFGNIAINNPTITVDSCLLYPNTGNRAISLYANLISKNNKYVSASVPFIKRVAATTLITLLGDYVNGNLFLDEAIATVSDIKIKFCKLFSSTSSISLYNAVSVVTWEITDNEFLLTNVATASAINITGSNCVFERNKVTDTYGNIISAKATSAGKTFSFKNNTCISTRPQLIYSLDYILTADSNIMISDQSSGISVQSSVNSSMPAIIKNNYIVSKNNGGPFVVLGSEYTSTYDNRMNGSEIFNNRFSGPGDYGNAVLAMHALFLWNQQASFHHNYLSGSFLGFVFKSNGGTYPNVIHSNIISNCTNSFTIKGIKGTLIYGNTCLNSAGYDGLSESQPGMTGDSGNSTVKNNIIITTNNAIQVSDATNAIGCVFDNNVYLKTVAGTFLKIGINYTFADWQTAGHDVNSLNSDPLLTNFIPANAIEIGATLDAAYDDGIDVSATWGSNITLPNVAKKQQVEPWQVGAIVK